MAMDQQTRQDQLKKAQAALKTARQRVEVIKPLPSIAESMTPTLQTFTPKCSAELEWTCPDCGAIVEPVPVEDHRGQTYYYPPSYCDCPQQQAKKEADETAAARQEWNDQARKLLEDSGLNRGKYAEFTLPNWDTDRPGSNAGAALATINEYIDQIISGAPVRGWLYLYGDYGLGKTHLAVGALRRIALKKLGFSEHWRVHIIVWPELCQATKESWSLGYHGATEAQMWGRARTSRILLIDDLDKTATSEWAMSKLFALINSRAVAGLPTIITANKSPQELKEVWGGSKYPHVADTGLAVLSRIADEMWGGVRFEGQDQRWVR